MPFKTTLSQLDAFRAVAKTLSYARAAEELGYSESAVHQQVRALEHALNLKLFSSPRHRLQLTDSGSRLGQLAEQVCVAVAGFERVAFALDREPRREVVIAATNMASGFVLQQIAGQFNDSYPDIRLQFHIARSRAAITGLIDGWADLGIVSVIPGPSGSPIDPGVGINVTPWISDEWVLAKAPGAVPARVFYHPNQIWVVSRLLTMHPSILQGAMPEYVPLDTLVAVKSAALGRLGFGLIPGLSICDEVAQGLFEIPTQTGLPHDLWLLMNQDATPSSRLVGAFLLAWRDANRHRLPHVIPDNAVTAHS